MKLCLSKFIVADR